MRTSRQLQTPVAVLLTMIVCLTASLGLGAAAVGASSSHIRPSKALFNLNVTSTAGVTQEAITLMAVDKGIFRKFGLNVNIVYSSNASAVIAGLVSGAVQEVDTGGGTIIGAIAAGDKITTVGQLLPYNTVLFYAAPSITSASQLNGVKIALSTPASAFELQVRQILDDFKVNAANVHFVYTGSVTAAGEALFTGAVQAAPVAIGPLSLQAQAEHYTLLFNGAKTKTPFDTDTMDFATSFVKAHPKVVQEYCDAMVDTIHVMRTDKSFALSELAKYFNESESANLSALELQYNDTLKAFIPPVPYVNYNQFVASDRILANIDPATAGVKVQSFVDRQFMVNAAKYA